MPKLLCGVSSDVACYNQDPMCYKEMCKHICMSCFVSFFVLVSKPGVLLLLPPIIVCVKQFKTSSDTFLCLKAVVLIDIINILHYVDGVLKQQVICFPLLKVLVF